MVDGEASIGHGEASMVDGEASIGQGEASMVDGEASIGHGEASIGHGEASMVDGETDGPGKCLTSVQSSTGASSPRNVVSEGGKA